MRLQNESLLLAKRLWLPAIVALGCCVSASAAHADSGLLFRIGDDATIRAGFVFEPDPRVRFEPEIGIAFRRSNREEEFRFGETNAQTTSFDVGLGILYVLPHHGPFCMYLGPRAGYSRRDSSSETTSFFESFDTDSNEDGWFASAALGAEVQVTSRASLGVEGALVYENSSGTVRVTGTTSGEDDFSASFTYSHFSMVLRWYLWGSE